jgi:hypothetical protein
MPPTDAAPSLMISFRRADTAAFAILGTAICSAAAWLAAARLGLEPSWAWGAAAGVSVLLPALLWTAWFELGIRAWNKLMRGSIVVLRAYVLKVCYYVLLAAVGRAGSSLDLVLQPGEASRWVRRDRPGCRVHAPEFSARIPWYRASDAVGRTGGRSWVVCLLPVVLLLRVLRNEWLENTPSSTTYTLY